ncbi:MAG: Mrp/NBP35 family ATP-binding protein, partial [Verrucomicrobiae bacterium]|nr:Mrp/NBP35 family ATP-binding protein [Verrucomicrobiae bacterium]
NLPGVRDVHVDVAPAWGGQIRGPDPWAGQRRVPGIKRIYAVASGKGGVGKTTVAVNLACAIKQLNKSVGLLDCDIYGPTVPLMMGVRQPPDVSPQSKIIPLVNFGVKLMSIGFFLEDGQPVIWRGPMLNKTIHQFLFEVEWGELDYLFVDLPPGTGDVQLSLCQAVPIDGAIIVTTPQEASLGVVRKGIAMFAALNVPIVGLIENMSFFTAPSGEKLYLFGQGGGQLEAQKQNVPFLGQIPVLTNISQSGDRGFPVVLSEPESEAARLFLEIGEKICQHDSNT